MDELDISSLSIGDRGARSLPNTYEAFDKLYPFLSDKNTISHVRRSKILFLMRGPPGSGKSTVVHRLQTLYPDVVVCSADNFFVTSDGSYQWDHRKLSDAHQACQMKAQEAAKRGQNIVIDNTNIRRWEMSEYYRIAGDNGYTVIVIIPQTPWLLDPTQLVRRNKHGISPKMCQDKVDTFRKTHPFYWAWFLNQSDSAELLKLANKYFDICVSRIPDFVHELKKCLSLADEEDLQFDKHYPLGSSEVKMLHCTAFYAGEHIDEASVEDYTNRDVYRQCDGRSFSLEVTGVVLTPRTVCARVELAGDQLLLHCVDAPRCTLPDTDVACGLASQDTRKRHPEVDSRLSVAEADACNFHSRAHITLGYTQTSRAAQAGDDLINVLHLAARRSQLAGPVTVDHGTLYYYGDGQCSVQFARPRHFSALFSACY